MARYIDAERLKDAFHTDTEHLQSRDEHLFDLIMFEIDEQPTADVVEVKHGEWKDRYNNKYYNHLYACSVCNKEALCEHYTNELGQIKVRQALTPLCPHCGAKMDVKRKEDV